MKSIGEIIRKERQKLDMTMNELAEKIGTSQSALSYIENDKRLPNHESLKKICTALNLDQNALQEMIQIRNQIAHGGPINKSSYSNYYSSNNEKNYGIKSAPTMKDRFFRPDFTVEFYPGYITAVQIKTKAKPNNQHSKNIQTGKLFNHFIERTLRELLEKEGDWISERIDSQFTEYIKELETFISFNNKELKISDVVMEDMDIFDD